MMSWRFYSVLWTTDASGECFTEELELSLKEFWVSIPPSNVMIVVVPSRLDASADKLSTSALLLNELVIHLFSFIYHGRCLYISDI